MVQSMLPDLFLFLSVFFAAGKQTAKTVRAKSLAKPDLHDTISDSLTTLQLSTFLGKKVSPVIGMLAHEAELNKKGRYVR